VSRQEYEPVRQLLCRAGRTRDGRLGIMRTLATADVLQIWLETGRRTTARDRRTHEVAGTELRHRGLLDPGALTPSVSAG
jgi:hypothetical protein